MTKLLASFFYIGYLPVMPGTYASLIGLLFFFLLKDVQYLLIGVTALVTFCGMFIAGPAEEVFKEKDSPKIVIDEVSGMLICFCFIKFTLLKAITLFCLFRIFDIIKPYPIKKIQDLKGSKGVMFDDIMAAFYAIISLYTLSYLFNLISLRTT